jgi:hypothetical protein
VGDLRLSPRYLPAIFTIDANLVPAISGYLPLSSPTYGFCTGYLRLSPGYLLDIFRCLFLFLLVFSSVMAFISLHEMLFAGTENLL